MLLPAVRRRPAPRTRRAAHSAPRSASGTRGRPPARRSARPARPRTRAGSRRSRRHSTRTRVVATVTANPASEAASGSSVLWVAYRPRASRCPIASNGTDSANAREHGRRQRARPRHRRRRHRAAPRWRAARRSRARSPRRPTPRRSSTALLRTSRRNPGRSPAAQAPDRVGKAASEMATPIRATGTLWKLRAKLTAETLPATRVEATLVKNRNVSGSIGWLAILGTISSRNSWRRAHPQVEPEADPHGRPGHADEADAEVEDGADDGAERGGHDPEALVEQDGAGDDADVVEDRREGVVDEVPLRDQHLAEGDRRREQDRRQQHQPEQVEVAGLVLGIEARGDDPDRLGGDGQHQQAQGGHDPDRQREHRLRELRRRVRIVGASEGREHRHERRGQAAGHEHVERELGQDEGRVVGVELGAGAVGAREDAVAEQAGEVARERQDREQHGAGGHEAREQGAEPRDHDSLRWPPRDLGPVTAGPGRVGRRRLCVTDRGAVAHRRPEAAPARTAPDRTRPHRRPRAAATMVP